MNARIRTRALVVASAFAVASAPAFGADLTTPDAVEAHVRAARGVPPAAYRVTRESTDAAGVVRIVTLREGDDFREDRDAGPLHTARGRVGGQAWRQNANGQTIVEERESEAAPSVDDADDVATTVARITTPVDGYLLSSLDARGFGTKRYVDASTWRVVRRDRVRAAGTAVTTYDDFRTVAGFTIPFRATTTDGDPKDDVETRTISLEAVPAAPAFVAIPDSRRVLVAFPAGTHTVTLPTRFIDGHVLVRVDVGGRGLDFLLDSGASGIVIDESVVKSLGLKEFGGFTNAANAGAYRQYSTIVPHMSVGPLHMTDVAVGTIPTLSPASADDVRPVGLLGFDFFGELVLKFDYGRQSVTAFDPSTFTAPDERDGFDVDLRLGSGVPLTTVSINGAQGTRFIVDTGGYGGVLLEPAFARDHPAAMVDEGGGAEKRLVSLVGVGGGIRTRAYQFKNVRFGRVDFHDFLAYAVDDPRQYAAGDDGTIGPAFLSLFDVYFDYADARLYLIFNDLGRGARSRDVHPAAAHGT